GTGTGREVCRRLEALYRTPGGCRLSLAVFPGNGQRGRSPRGAAPGQRTNRPLVCRFLLRPDPVPARQARRFGGSPPRAGEKTRHVQRSSAACSLGRARLPKQAPLAGTGTEGCRRSPRQDGTWLGSPLLAWEEGGHGQGQPGVAEGAGPVLLATT